MLQPFLTPRSRMLYAGRMGESTHAYQSPSKDLKFINSRIAAHSQQPITAQHLPAAAENDAVRSCSCSTSYLADSALGGNQRA